MAERILSENEVFSFLGLETEFTKESILVSGKNNENYLNWKSGDPCVFGGLIKLPNSETKILICYGDEYLDTEEFTMDEIVSQVKIPKPNLPRSSACHPE